VKASCNKTGTVFINVTMRRVRATTDTLEEQLIVHIQSVCVCSLIYLACKAHARFYVFICDLSRFPMFFHIVL